jgi:hypothetical protein
MKANLFILLLLLTRWTCHASLSTVEEVGDDEQSMMSNGFPSGIDTAPEFTLILPSPSDGIAFCGNGFCDSDEEDISCPSDCSNLELITADAGGDNMTTIGLVFSIKSFRDVIITSMDIFTQSAAIEESVQLYTHDGEYSRHEMRIEEWELMYDNPALELLGTYSPTTLNDMSVSIYSGMVKSFLVHIPNNRIRCIEGANGQAVSALDNIIVMYKVSGLADKFPKAGLFSSELSCTFTGTIR